MADETIPRRDFLRGAVGTAAALTTVRSIPAEAQPASSAGASATLSAAAPDAEPLLTLTATEHAFIVAAVDTIIPADELSPSGSDCGVAAFIDRQLAGAYGMGARLYRQSPG
jgi:gluconate 2-dehydrogenase gamma chain